MAFYGRRGSFALKPDCFADIDTVFPRRPDGLRESPSRCLACGLKVECLKAALSSPEGAGVERGGLARNTAVGRVLKGYRRWSTLKTNRQGDTPKGKRR